MFSEACVSHSVHGRGGLPSGGLVDTPSGTDIQWRPLQRSVRILLECILVFCTYFDLIFIADSKFPEFVRTFYKFPYFP